MHITARGALIVAPLILLALTACGTGGTGTGGTGDGSGGEADGGVSTTECIAGKTWVLDLDDSASQLGAQLASGGLNVTQSEGEGRQTFTFDDDGHAIATIDVTYTITVDSGDGIVITLVQTHAGEPFGEWAWLDDSTTISFADWDNAGYSIQNTVLVNGTAGDFPITVPDETLGETDMETECSGSTLTTHVEASPFTQHWNAEG
jgi:hypothetical protein